MKQVSLLSKAEMKNVMGGLVNPDGSGGDLCVISVTYANGQVGTGDYVAPTDNGSSWANNLCVGWITSGQVASCRYDCAHDGFGV
ncbi:hypothetical protein DU508_11210 [Pedobacter chinensis]|uniref:Bacteriocin n=1 Tax=Pedobacter chinensis TaxID=2282421 RepID=A0A369PYX0_9SPHI|nr:hypothetical protein [Pedobacter chinensis]RDC56177.1 hypothetical protein DU508_11210 [Pedobacter chinensis]